MIVIALYVIGIAPNEPEVRAYQLPGFLWGVALTIFSANLTVISLYFIIRFWRR